MSMPDAKQETESYQKDLDELETFYGVAKITLSTFDGDGNLSGTRTMLPDNAKKLAAIAHLQKLIDRQSPDKGEKTL